MPLMIVQRGMDFIKSSTGKKFTSGHLPAPLWCHTAMIATLFLSAYC